MKNSMVFRATLSFLIFVLGSWQAWDSNVPQAGLWIVLLVSLAIPLTPLALLLPLRQQYVVGALVLAFILLALARLTSPILLPGLFIILVPSIMGLIFTGLVKQEP